MTLIRRVFNFILGGKHNYKRIELILNKQQYLLMKKERDCGCGGSFRTHITCVSMHEGVNSSPCASFFFKNLIPFYLIFYFCYRPSMCVQHHWLELGPTPPLIYIIIVSSPLKLGLLIWSASKLQARELFKPKCLSIWSQQKTQTFHFNSPSLSIALSFPIFGGDLFGLQETLRNFTEMRQIKKIKLHTIRQV